MLQPLLDPGTHVYLKSSMDLRRYISLQGLAQAFQSDLPQRRYSRSISRLRLLQQKEIPFSEQYFLGGADDLRGYDVETDIGGNSEILGQAELPDCLSASRTATNWLSSPMLATHGEVFMRAAGSLSTQKLTPLADYGLGVRLKTPVGPIRLQNAIGSSGGQTQFSIGPSF